MTVTHQNTSHQTSPILPIVLGVNIDHVATIRQLRNTPYPDILQALEQVEAAGADSITIHLREDRRHIQDNDVYLIAKQLITRLNFECAHTREMVEIAKQIRPHSVCFVPERRQEITTEGGLDVCSIQAGLSHTIAQLKALGIRTSLFVNADLAQISAAASVGADMIEIHTGAFSDAAASHQAAQLDLIKTAAQHGHQLGLQVNAGHGLHLGNTAAIVAIPEIVELNIGHAIVSRALFVGLAQAVREMKALMLHTRQTMQVS